MADPKVINSLKFLQEILLKEHDLSSDALKLVLLDHEFVYNPATHGQYSDVSASEIAGENGYTTGGVAMPAASVNIGTGKVTVSFAENVSIEAVGGDIASSAAAVVINDTHNDKTIVCGIDYDNVYLTTDGKFLHFNLSDGLFEVEPELTGGA